MASVPWWINFQTEPGNIRDLENLPEALNPYAPDALGNPTTSTLWSASSADDSGNEVIYPQVVGGVVMDPNTSAAWDHYRKTGQHLGKYSTVPAAEAAANQLHLEQEQIARYRPKKSKNKKKSLQSQIKSLEK